MIGIVYAYWASYKEDISYNHRCTLAFLLIKFPERSGETYCFCSVSSSSYYSFSSSFSSSCSSFSFYPNLSGRHLGNQWTDCSETWEHGRYGCEVVQQDFKILNVALRLAHGRAKNQQKNFRAIAN